MMDKIRVLLDKLFSEKNLILRFREPAACEFCSPLDAIQMYHAAYRTSKRFVVEDPSKIKKLVILEDNDLISGKCPKCGAIRVRQKFQLEKIFWTTCTKCRTKTFSLIERKCPICNEESKEAKEKFFKERGG